MSSTLKKIDRTALDELLKKRFFYGPSFAPYGGVSGLFDYGPPGTALQANLVDSWRKHFVLEEDILEVDCSILTPHDVLKTSGHVERFSDLMCKDLKTGDIFRVDHLIENELEKRLEEHQEALKNTKPNKPLKKLSDQEKSEYETILAKIDGFSLQEFSDIIKKYQIKSQNGNEISEPEIFNLMFGTAIGPTGLLKGYLRPETAQGQFLNFRKLLEFNNDKMPFAAAHIGKSFRNEISPRAGLLRVREFLMAEIEHFVHPEQKDHPKFQMVENIELNLLPAETQTQGKTDITRMTIGDAVKKQVVNNQTLGYFMARIYSFLIKIGIKESHLRFRQHMKTEMAHYACDCWDAEIFNSYGWIECVGCADRSAYDLTRHSQATGTQLTARRTLDQPVKRTATNLMLNKKKTGPKFKKDAKWVEKWAENLSSEEKQKIGKVLQETGKIELELEQGWVPDGQSKNGGTILTLDSDLVSIEEKEEVVYVEEYVPNVIEPSFGMGRILYSLLEHVYYVREGDEQRKVLGFPALVAPIKCLLLPISNKPEFQPLITQLSSKLRSLGLSTKVDDSGASIGKRYARYDELGVPFAITVDMQSLNDQTITLRERDSTKQIREKPEVVLKVVKDLCEGETTWEKVAQLYPEFTQQQLD